MIALNLLILANDFETEAERFREYFEEVETKSLADVLVDVNGETRVSVDGRGIENWDSVYIDPEPKAFNYTRVLMEAIERKEVNCSMNASSVFILGKKPYLFSVLSDRGVKIPRQASISTEKGLTEIERDLDFPVVAKKYSSLELSETKIFEDFDALKSFAELSEHGEDYVMVRERIEEGEVFETLYIDERVVSLKLEEDPSEKERYDSIEKKYHGISGEQKELVKEAAESVGAEICKIRIKGDQVLDIQARPELEEFKQRSGKNVYGRVSDFLKKGGEPE